ncbi:MAG: hypothetical protein VYE22_37290 [Myxococcota bacterium]|nr:hypothetical protein [Myxococcota bacterium]
MSKDALFERVVELCGFSAYVGPGAVRRALAEAGQEPAGGVDAYRAALPALKRRLEVYVSEEDAAARVAKIEAFLAGVEARGGRVAVAAAEAAQTDEETQWGKRRFGRTVQILKSARGELDPEG